VSCASPTSHNRKRYFFFHKELGKIQELFRGDHGASGWDDEDDVIILLIIAGAI
jgi:hypothetical protein